MKVHFLFAVFSFLFFQSALSQYYMLDSAFGTNGTVLNTATSGIQSMVLQDDGKIIGFYKTSYSIMGNEHLIRFNADGSIDTAFGTNGIVNTLLFNQSGKVEMIKLQNDGKILIVGTLNATTSYDFGIARFNTDGSIDTSFGTNGYANIDIASGGDWAQTIEIQSDGKILIGGNSTIYYPTTGDSADLAVVRLSANGILDTTFGTNGKFTMNGGSTGTLVVSSGVSSDWISDISCDSLGNIFLGCNSNVSETIYNNTNFLVVSLNSNGILNTSFGENGKVIIDFGAIDSLNKIQVTNDHKIIVGGENYYTVGSSFYSRMAFAKLLSDGNYDASFGTNGKVVINRDSSSLHDIVQNFIIFPDGKLLGTGATVDPITNLSADFLLIRFNSDGTIDTAFNSTGYVATSNANGNIYAMSILLQNDGKIILGGGLAVGSSYQTVLTRYVEVPLSITDSDSKNTIIVSPNPFNDSISISAIDIDMSLATMELFDVSGRKKNISSVENKNNFTILMNDNLSSGHYLLKITFEGRTETVKIIKR